MTISRCSCLIDCEPPPSRNSAASQSSSSGCVGSAPLRPKSLGVSTMPRPKWYCQTRLTIDRQVSGLRRSAIHPPARRGARPRRRRRAVEARRQARHAADRARTDLLPRSFVAAALQHVRSAAACRAVGVDLRRWRRTPSRPRNDAASAGSAAAQRRLCVGAIARVDRVEPVATGSSQRCSIQQRSRLVEQLRVSRRQVRRPTPLVVAVDQVRRAPAAGASIESSDVTAGPARRSCRPDVATFSSARAKT